jgi:pimeloyl-ACP methyl ester carboxylesterase
MIAKRLIQCLLLSAALVAGGGATIAAEASLAGAWSGELEVGGGKLPIVFHVVEKDGALSATMDSPSQGALGIPVSSAAQKDGKVELGIASIKGEFVGELSADGKSIQGFWKQGGASLPLLLARGEPATKLARRQEPEPPYPYAVEELKIAGGTKGVELGGSLVIPSGKGPFPAVVFVTGSGPQDRDETILGHKPFLVIADYLAKRGIASFRYDDRGVASSTGDYGSATTLDFAADAEAALGYLAARKELDPQRLGVIGHSEGGLVADIVASRNASRAAKASFIVSLAGPALRGDRLLLLQGAALARAMGMPEREIEESRETNERLYAIAMSDEPPEAIKLEAKRVYLEYLASNPSFSEADRTKGEKEADSMVASLVLPWTRGFLSLDPARYLAALDIPVLALGGTKDLQVPVDADFAALESSIGPKASLSVLRLEGLNHLFQHCATGLPGEYGAIEETFAPEALEAIGDWIGSL